MIANRISGRPGSTHEDVKNNDIRATSTNNYAFRSPSIYANGNFMASPDPLKRTLSIVGMNNQSPMIANKTGGQLSDEKRGPPLPPPLFGMIPPPPMMGIPPPTGGGVILPPPPGGFKILPPPPNPKMIQPPTISG
jgi:hypothetical protein